MRIVIYSLNFSPELTGIGKYSGEMAEWLAESGHDVRVVTAPPYYPQWRVADGFSARRYRKERVVGGRLQVYRCPLWVPIKPSSVKRLLHLASFAVCSLPVMVWQILWRPDVVFVVEPPLCCAPQAWLVARLSGAKAWLHIQDFEVDAAFDLGLLRSGWLRRCVLIVERALMCGFDRISTVSINMQRKLADKGVQADRGTFFPNWVDGAHIYPLERISQYRAELGIDEQACVALYSGNMGEKQGLEVVVEVARRFMGNANIVFVLCGDGAARERLMQQAQGLPNIRWIPLQPTERLNELLNVADIHVLPQRAGMGELMMPSKLLGMLASGRPVVAMAEHGTQLENEVTPCGIILRPGDIDGLASALAALARNPGERKRLGIAARSAAKKWGKETVMQEFEGELRKV